MDFDTIIANINSRIAISYRKNQLLLLLAVLDGQITEFDAYMQNFTSVDFSELDGILDDDNYEFVGLAFGKKFDSGQEIGLEPPFDPNVHAVFKKYEDNDEESGSVTPHFHLFREVSEIRPYHYEKYSLTFPRENLIEENGNVLNSQINRNDESRGYLKRLQFSTGNPTFEDFGFALFNKYDLSNILAFSEDYVYLSGAQIEFGIGHHEYKSPDGDRIKKQFTLKIEADRVIEFRFEYNTANLQEINIGEASNTSYNLIIPPSVISAGDTTGEPEFILGTPCPPHWDRH